MVYSLARSHKAMQSFTKVAIELNSGKTLILVLLCMLYILTNERMLRTRLLFEFLFFTVFFLFFGLILRLKKIIVKCSRGK